MTDILKEYQDQGPANFTLPSVHGQNEALDKLGKDSYTMTTKDGKDAGKVLPKSKREGLWWHDGKKYDVKWEGKNGCGTSAFLWDGPGKPRRVQVMISIPDSAYDELLKEYDEEEAEGEESRKRFKVKRAEDGEDAESGPQPEDLGVKITVISSNLKFADKSAGY
ncbi:hypothetical protein CDD83_1062 [Cordyceps sp. RAO-2017]|nr:hypothetical protein CDD83_1062 [Cordyceps sp. RAO-2017]